MYMIILGSEIAHNVVFKTLDEADAYALELGGECQVLKCDAVRSYPRLLTEAQRNKLLDEVVDLKEYANMSICGDGMEVDVAHRELYEMDDEQFIEFGITLGMGIDHGAVDLKEGNAELCEALKEWPGLFEKVIERMTN